jgi:hypothetical protein
MGLIGTRVPVVGTVTGITGTAAGILGPPNRDSRFGRAASPFTAVGPRAPLVALVRRSVQDLRAAAARHAQGAHWLDPPHRLGGPTRLPAASASGAGRTPATSTPGLGPPLTNLQRDWAHPCRDDTGTGSPLTNLRRDFAQSCAGTASGGGGSLLGIGGVWAQVIVATNIAETSITIDDIVCALKQARAQPNKEPSQRTAAEANNDRNARTHGRTTG